MATATSPVDVNSIWSRLVGLGPWRRAAAALPPPDTYNDASVQRIIPATIRKFERETNTFITPSLITTRPQDLIAGGTVGTAAMPLVVENAYDYYDSMAENYFPFRLRKRPVQQLRRVRVLIQDQTIFEIPFQWFSVNTLTGDVNILPNYGALLVNMTVNGLAFLNATFGSADYLPNAIHVDYVCGFQNTPGLVDGAGNPVPWWLDPYGTQLEDGSIDPVNINPAYADTIRCLEEFCARQVLDDIAQLADAGLSGMSLSGGVGSQNFSYTRFMDRKQELDASIKAYMDTFRAQESPFMTGVIGI